MMNSLSEKFKRLLEDYLKTIFLEENMLFSAINYSLLNPGKRLRPLIILLGAEYLKINIKKMLPIAGSVEIMHTASLIHDDLPIMDDDDFRRGKPSLHKVYGADMALVAGDLMISKSFQLISDSDFHEEKKSKLLKKAFLVWGEMGLCRGQGEEIEFSKTKKGSPLSIIKLKTASLFSYSFSAPFVLSGESEDIELDFSLLGESLGILFQINDDKNDINDKSFNIFRHMSKNEIEEIEMDSKNKAFSIIQKYDLMKTPYSEILNYFLEV